METFTFLILISCATLSRQTTPPEPRVLLGNPARRPPLCSLSPGKVRVFQDLRDYKVQNASFGLHEADYQGNVVEFATGTFDETLQRNSFISFDSVKVFGLRIPKKQIKHIEEGAFFGLDCLYQLDLSLNNVTVLSRETFNGLPYLRHLNVSYNAIDNITGFFDKAHLSVLDLSHNELVALPSLRALAGLKVLNVSYNQIEQITERVFEGIDALEELYLSHNRLWQFNMLHWITFGTLKKLDVAYNLFEYVNLVSKFETRNLEMLNISGNNIMDLDVLDVKITMKKLALLDIRDNDFKCVTLHTILRDLKGINVSVVHPISCDDHCNTFGTTELPSTKSPAIQFPFAYEESLSRCLDELNVVTKRDRSELHTSGVHMKWVIGVLSVALILACLFSVRAQISRFFYRLFPSLSDSGSSEDDDSAEQIEFADSSPL
ncbi:unnamed protein product [Acanthoscelides obtectus]|uniref:Uncharacterized protein n=1 Tax=Acanthoscelides obtectus TaxID=200917 RepID=A0A9P0JNE0_ACAOB|nr:unnamed protein product [Acanthoscelides obtectus]CAK1625020.1 Leucine-rich repeat transmembrane neuronal protein 2 [Acanthoscelides obtectus]